MVYRDVFFFSTAVGSSILCKQERSVSGKAKTYLSIAQSRENSCSLHKNKIQQINLHRILSHTRNSKKFRNAKARKKIKEIFASSLREASIVLKFYETNETEKPHE